MQRIQIEVMTGTFVMFEGLDKPTEDTSGYWQSYPTEVPDRDVNHALSIMPANTFRFRFFDVHLPTDVAEQRHKDGKLDMFLSGHEMRNLSGYFYAGCILITPQQAFEYPRIWSSSRFGREVLVPVTRLLLPSDATYLAHLPEYQIVIGADRRGHFLRRGDTVASTRTPDAGEFRTLFLCT